MLRGQAVTLTSRQRRECFAGSVFGAFETVYEQDAYMVTCKVRRHAPAFYVRTAAHPPVLIASCVACVTPGTHTVSTTAVGERSARPEVPCCASRSRCGLFLRAPQCPPRSDRGACYRGGAKVRPPVRSLPRACSGAVEALQQVPTPAQ